MSETEVAKPAEPSMIDIANRLFEELESEVELDRAAAKINTSGKIEVLDAQDASRLSGLIVSAERELEETKAAAAIKVAQARAKVEKMRYLFEGALRIWAEVELKKQTSKKPKKSIVLDRATLAFSKQSDYVVTENEDTLAKWAEEHLPESLTLIPKVSIEAVAAWEEANQKIAPGRHQEKDLPDNFYVRAAKAQKE
jgi:hypothetical protein